MHLRVIPLILLVLALCATPASAVMVTYTLEQGASGGFQYSFIHSATNTAGMAPYYPGGAKWFRVSGDIEGDFTAGVLTLSPSTITAEGLPSGPYSGQTWTLDILSGTISAPVGAPDDSFLGSFDYDLVDPNDSTIDTGTFYFYHGDFGVEPQVVTETSLVLWGNNWRNFAIGGDPAQTPSSVPLPMGIDVKGSDESGGPGIPEPASALLLSFGAVGLLCSRRRLRHR